jgi:UDP-glucose 4-epimerase
LKILVTGGLGYIGSHVTVLLLESGAEVVSIDNIDNSHIEVLEGIKAITGKKPAFELPDLKHRFLSGNSLNTFQNFDVRIVNIINRDNLSTTF